MMKNWQDIDVTDRTSMVYTENKTELLWLFGSDAIFDENKIRQRRDRSYRCDLG